MTNSVSFKGTREGLLITLGDGAWHELLNELGMQLDRPSAQSFFQGARVLLDTGSRTIEVVQLEELIALLAQHNMTLASVMGARETQEAFEQVQATLPPPPESLSRVNDQGHLGEESEAALPAGSALLIRRTVRSGQVVRNAGTIVIIGDVNPGAEVIAEGDIIVWGKLRGYATGKFSSSRGAGNSPQMEK